MGAALCAAPSAQPAKSATPSSQASTAGQARPAPVRVEPVQVMMVAIKGFPTWPVVEVTSEGVESGADDIHFEFLGYEECATAQRYGCSPRSNITPIREGDEVMKPTSGKAAKGLVDRYKKALGEVQRLLPPGELRERIEAKVHFRARSHTPRHKDWPRREDPSGRSTHHRRSYGPTRPCRTPPRRSLITSEGESGTWPTTIADLRNLGWTHRRWVRSDPGRILLHHIAALPPRAPRHESGHPRTQRNTGTKLAGMAVQSGTAPPSCPPTKTARST